MGYADAPVAPPDDRKWWQRLRDFAQDLATSDVDYENVDWEGNGIDTLGGGQTGGKGQPGEGLTQAQIDAIYADSQATSASAFDDFYRLMGNPGGQGSTNPDIAGTGGGAATGIYADIQNLPTFTEWMEQQGNTFGDTEGIQGMIDALAGQMGDLDPNSPEAQAYAASIGGFDTWEDRQTFIQGLQTQMEDAMGRSNSDELSPLQQRAMRRTTAEMENRAQRLVADSYSESGSMGRMMLQADEMVNQIANVEIQGTVQMANENKNRALEQYAALSQGYAQQVQQGSMSSTQFVESKRLALGSAVEAYNTEMQAIFSQNEQYFQAHQADYQVIVKQIELNFAAIQMEMGLLMGELQYASSLAEQALAPHYTGYDLAALHDAFTLDFGEMIAIMADAADIVAGLSGVPLPDLDIDFG